MSRSRPPVSAAASDFGASHVATVDIGNPHLVLCVTDPEAVELSVEEPRLEADYPAGINVHFVSVDQAGEIDLRVWERGPASRWPAVPVRLRRPWPHMGGASWNEA
ncbi:MAG: hypothetical protein R2789_15215 [Microthrixaceae bacterium]